ncbi:histidine phosphatase family protein [Magnetovibrio sp. PR-2]|uniref:histidine phosphatase family protein n=1 Tax=Magnetovibrio sp. PR-2 TaxID=3120356 RepID=UPI002FCE2C4D
MKFLSAVIFAILTLSFGSNAWSQDKQALPPSLEEMRQGGNIIFFRHAITDHKQMDMDEVDLADCSTQRNLSEEGRAQSLSIGKAIRDQEIPVGEVLSSPFCRCMDTAKLAFGAAEPSDFLYYAIGLKKAQKEIVTKSLQNLLSSPVPEGTNRVIVSHTGNLREAAGIWPKPEGVAWVFRPGEKGQFETLGKINPQDWAKLQ